MTDENMTPNDSGWRLWGVGHAVQRKARGDLKLAVTTFEHLSMQSGPVADNQEDYTQRLGDSFGATNSQTLKGSKIIQATWAPMGDNHLITAPMVDPGEAVLLYQMGDQSEFYWTTLWSSLKIRRKDFIVFGAANQPKFGLELDKDSMYYLEMDTDKEKVLRLATSLSDGEKFKYELLFDAKGNTATIKDDVGNIITINSQENNVSIQDSAGAIFETRNGHPRIYGPKGVLIEGPFIEVQGDTTFKDKVTILGSTNMSGGVNASGDSGSGSVMQIEGSLMIMNELTVQGYAHLNGGYTGD